MDSEVWKMAATSFKIINPKKGIFAQKVFQVNCGKYITTERRVKKPSNVSLNEESVQEEDTLCSANGFKSVEQGELIKVCVRQSKTTICKPSVDKWTDCMSNSKDYRKSLALTTSGTESQNVTRVTSEPENKRLPILVSDISHTLIPHRQERSSVLLRQDGKIICSNVKNQVSNHCSKTKSARTNIILKKEPLFQGLEDLRCKDTSLYRGIPFNYSNKRVILKNNVPHHSDTSDTYKRRKISDDINSVHNVGRICQKMFDQHQLSHRQMPAVSSAQTYSDTRSRKTDTNGVQKDKLRNSPPDEMKGGISSFKEKDKTEGRSTPRRFLLIDSQGLPYTVVVEEPISVGLSNSTSTSWSDNTIAGISKSVAPRKVYKCPVCFRIFEYLSYLQRHSIAHSQQKPHVCKVCGKAFKRTSHLTRHKYTHFGGKPCQCQICQHRFRDAGELARHQQSHTGEKNH